MHECKNVYHKLNLTEKDQYKHYNQKKLLHTLRQRLKRKPP